MVKKKTYLIFFSIFILIGLIHGLISVSIANFISWILIGLWLIFIIKIFENTRRHREFNSPHNTAFFVILPLFIGISYSLWGPFSGFLGENLNGTSLYFSWWSLIFALPFIILGLYSLYRCFKKYRVIYFGKKSVKAKALGYFLSISIIIFIIFYWISSYNFAPLDFNLLILLVTTILVLIIFGFTRNASRPVINRDYIAERQRRVNNLTRPTTQRRTARSTTVSRPTPSTRSNTTRTSTRSQTTRRTPTSQRKTTKTSSSTVTRTRSVKQTPTRKPTPRKRIDFSKFKPKGSYLSQEDFKCIFCFRLQKLPDDKGRGIVICPNCGYPAHADEFRDWMRTSNLCSRCSSPIPTNFRRNPKIINVKDYIIIYRHFLKK